MFNPWVEKIFWRRKWQLTPVFLPGKSHGQRSLAGYSPQDHEESDTTEVTEHAHTIHLQSLYCPVSLHEYGIFLYLFVLEQDSPHLIKIIENLDHIKPYCLFVNEFILWSLASLSKVPCEYALQKKEQFSLPLLKTNKQQKKKETEYCLQSFLVEVQNTMVSIMQ